MSNKRSYPRRIVNWLVHWASGQASGTGHICDVGAGGMFLYPIVSFDGAQLDSEVLLHFTVPGHAPGSEGIRAKIRWIGRNASYGVFGYGVEFDLPSSTIQAFVTDARAA